MAMVVPGLIPSFWTSGFPEYPAIFAALAACRLLPPVAALVHHPPDPAGRVVGDVQGAVGAHGHTHRPVGVAVGPDGSLYITDRKSTRLNSSHQIISYAVFCLKKKKINNSNSR